VIGHRTNIMEKLNIHSSTELVKFAIREGIVDVGT
jgi:DNA-binding NarL/FixJ family response regulator